MSRRMLRALGATTIIIMLAGAPGTVAASAQGSTLPAVVSAAAIGAPGGLAPADGASLQQPEAPPTLSWGAVRGADHYVVEVDEGAGADFVDARVYETDATALVVPDALPAAEEGTAYSWRVRSVTATGVESRFSADRSFTLVPLDQVTLTGPADNAVVQDVVLDWEPLVGAQYYQLQVSSEDDFSTSTIIDEQTKVLGTRYSPAVSYDNNTYYWRVRAVDTSGNPSAWSDATESGSHPRSFVRSWPHKPAPVWPEDGGTLGDAMYLEWTPVRHASQYELQMGTDQNFSPDTYESCILPGTTYTPGMFRINESNGPITRLRHEKCVPTPGVQVFWRVRALDTPFYRSGTNTDGVQGLFSPTRSFVYHEGATPFGALAPANGAVVDVPVLSWSSVRSADYYEVSVRTNTGSAVVSRKKTYATSYIPVTGVDLTAAKSPYTWQVTAYDARGLAVSTTVERRFSVSDASPTGGPWSGGGTPLTPLTANNPGTSIEPLPLLAWAPHPDADHYLSLIHI